MDLQVRNRSVFMGFRDIRKSARCISTHGHFIFDFTDVADRLCGIILSIPSDCTQNVESFLRWSFFEDWGSGSDLTAYAQCLQVRLYTRLYLSGDWPHLPLSALQVLHRVLRALRVHTWALQVFTLASLLHHTEPLTQTRMVDTDFQGLRWSILEAIHFLICNFHKCHGQNLENIHSNHNIILQLQLVNTYY